MPSQVKTLTFVSRWEDIPLWRVVNLVCPAGNIRAEYQPGTEIQIGSTWQYQFVIQEADLPAGVTFDQIINSFLVTPFVTQVDPCVPTQSSCFDSLPVLGVGEHYKLAVVVGPSACGTWCLKQTPAPDQYEHGGTWDDHPGQPAPV